ncbi:MAG TPA: hypothetical protein VGB85_33140 [Nannocystis sp.]|jgi:hypothetical protein
MSQPTSDPSPQQRAPPGPAAAVDLDSSPVVRASFSMRGFMDGWMHCRHVADYLARFAASDRYDPERLTTRLSNYLNEALELVFRSAPGPGQLIVAIYRQHDRLEVTLACPVTADDRMRRSVRRATEAEAAANYRRGFVDLVRPGDGGRAPPASEDPDEWEADAGLLELVALHGITLALSSVADDVDNAVTLHMTVPHE